MSERTHSGSVRREKEDACIVGSSCARAGDPPPFEDKTSEPDGASFEFEVRRTQSRDVFGLPKVLYWMWTYTRSSATCLLAVVDSTG